MKPYAPKPRKMNLTEKRYVDQLEMMRLNGEIVDWRYEPMRFKVGEGAWYKPDFLIVLTNKFEIHEVKGGFIRTPAMVRFKAAMMLYPWFKWKMMQWKNGEWKVIKEN